VAEKAAHLIRVGDVIVVPQGVLFRTIRVKALGSRRGPPMEAQLLYEEAAAPVSVSTRDPPWEPLLFEQVAREVGTHAKPNRAQSARRIRRPFSP